MELMFGGIGLGLTIVWVTTFVVDGFSKGVLEGVGFILYTGGMLIASYMLVSILAS